MVVIIDCDVGKIGVDVGIIDVDVGKIDVHVGKASFRVWFFLHPIPEKNRFQ
ncbi:hypothetical protein [Paenisporosarcina sp.]|uniref:hypothetical protein n=1 Tax=Paenisporosarcina sp. TaxID=1932001 RepID=UPI003C736248